MSQPPDITHDPGLSSGVAHGTFAPLLLYACWGSSAGAAGAGSDVGISVSGIGLFMSSLII